MLWTVCSPRVRLPFTRCRPTCAVVRKVASRFPDVKLWQPSARLETRIQEFVVNAKRENCARDKMSTFPFEEVTMQGESKPISSKVVALVHEGSGEPFGTHRVFT